MTDQDILNGAKDITCKGAISVSVTGLYLQKPFGITYFYSESGKEWLKTDASIFAGSRLLSDIRKIAELEEALKAVKKDLLIRAEEDSDGCKVVSLGSSVWIQLKEALKEQDNG